MLRELESEIQRQTNADIHVVPANNYANAQLRTGHGMRFSGFRNWLPKKSFDVQGDVLWYILMGPENYDLDLLKDWNKNSYKVVYLFDTLEPQFELIKKLFSKKPFDLCITSFADAVPYLQALTGHQWHAIEQAVPEQIFPEVAVGERVIDFSSYGRRLERFHKILIDYCNANQLYYDYSMQASRNVQATAQEFYKQYAWHLSHSKFTISWPVELTSPARAGRLHPVTCRWFEAAAAGTVVVGRPPANEFFNGFFFPKFVLPVDPDGEASEIYKVLDHYYQDHESLLYSAAAYRAKQLSSWTWKERVKRMLSLLPDQYKNTTERLQQKDHV